MLDFFFIRDEQPKGSDQVNSAGGIDYEEFIKAQDLKIIENHLDYYGDFRWKSQAVKHKHALLNPTITIALPHLAAILRQSFAVESGLIAFGD